MPIAKKRPEKSASKKGKEKDTSTTTNVAAKAEKDSSAGADTKEEAESYADRLRREGVVATYALNSKKIHRNVRDISVTNLTVTFHGTPIIEEADLFLNYGNRYGYIGRNGCGKSTFMKVIAARCFPIPDGIDIFHLSEEIEATDMTAKEAVMSVDVERARLEAEAEELNDIVSNQEGSENAEEAMERLTQVYERLEQLDAATAETRASKILSGLGFTKDKQNKKTREFSGGWRMRIALARALFIQPTLLLLDEPTNHLDMDAVVWLEDYLSKWDKILFMVSHSQDFMNNVCTHIVHHTKKKLVYYSGNYDSFVKTREEKEEEREKRYKAEQDQIKHMKDYVAKFGQGNAKMARQAQSKEKTLEKMLRGGLTEKVEHEKALDFKFPDPPKLSPPVLQCNDITFGYPGCEVLYSGVDFGVDLDSRVALVGPNGAGKSTLLKIMTGELLPVTGSVRPHAHLRISKFTQHFIDVLDLNLSPLDYFLSLWLDMTREEGRKFLGRFGISGSVQTQVMSQLSDGQKSRVVLAKMAKECPHMLFLDEPTNHLDMESIDSLAKAINSFTGGMVLVSHDMRLISQVAKEIWLCDKRTVTKYVGEISDFKIQLRRQMQMENLIEGDPNLQAKEISLVPLAPKKAYSSSSGVGSSQVVNNIVVALPPPPSKAMTEEEKIQQARLELAELAIAKQRARQATQTSSSTGEVSKDKEVDTAVDVEDSEEAKKAKEEEKAAAKAKRKAEKEAILLQEKREEEERIRRREEKLREQEDALKLKEQKRLEHEEFLKQKAVKDAVKKAQEEAEAALLAEAAAKRRAEREERKRQKQLEKIAAQEKARLAAEAMVQADIWTQDQQIRFENALLEFTCAMDRRERWTKIAAAVGQGDGSKTINQCIARYKYIKQYVLEKIHIDLSSG